MSELRGAPYEQSECKPDAKRKRDSAQLEAKGAATKRWRIPRLIWWIT